MLRQFSALRCSASAYRSHWQAPTPSPEFYKTATLTGAAPAGHPVMLQVWQYLPQITDLGTASVLATAKGANQGVAQSASYYFTTGATPADPTAVCKINTFDASWTLLFTHDTLPDFASQTQTNGLYYDAASGKLYAATNNFPTTPSSGAILEYTVNANGSLTFVAAHPVVNGSGNSFWVEGCCRYNGSFWVAGHDKWEIWQFDASWNFVAAYALPGTSAFQAPNGELFQGICPLGNGVFVVNLHGNNALSPKAYAFRFTGAGFRLEPYTLTPPTDCCQGVSVSYDGTSLLWARRNNNGSTNPADVVSTPIVNSYEGVGLEGRSRADFSDVRITTADGLTVLAGGGAGWREHYISGQTAWFHFALPADITTSADFRVYYGNDAATWSEAGAAAVTSKINDFEADRGDFTNNYNTGSAVSTAGGGLLGTAGLAVSSPGTGDGVYSDDLDFINTLTRLSGWVKPTSGQSGSPPAVYFMQTVTGTTRRRGAIAFDGHTAQGLSNAVLQTAFASNIPLDSWRRFEVRFDYANSKFGLKVWTEDGVLRGSVPVSTYALDNGTRVYKDVLLFRAMMADRIFSQPLVANEPAWGAWSAEAGA